MLQTIISYIILITTLVFVVVISELGCFSKVGCLEVSAVDFEVYSLVIRMLFDLRPDAAKTVLETFAIRPAVDLAGETIGVTPFVLNELEAVEIAVDVVDVFICPVDDDG